MTEGALCEKTICARQGTAAQETGSGGPGAHTEGFIAQARPGSFEPESVLSPERMSLPVFCLSLNPRFVEATRMLAGLGVCGHHGAIGLPPDVTFRPVHEIAGDRHAGPDRLEVYPSYPSRPPQRWLTAGGSMSFP